MFNLDLSFLHKTGLARWWTKVLRTCPRCRNRNYHGATRPRTDPIPNVVTVTCSDCGHRWVGRYKREEWDGG